jgi:hypothetical protein
MATHAILDDVVGGSAGLMATGWPDGLLSFSGNAHDLSGNGNPEQLRTVVTDDRFGRLTAHTVDGVGDYIRIPYSDTLSFPHDLSVAAWIKTTDDVGGIAHEHNGGSDGNFVFGLSQGGRLRFGRSPAVGGGLYDSDFVNDGQWHFVIGLFDSVNHVVKVYIDGYFASSFTDLQSLPDNHIPLIIGDETNHLYAFDGVIDDVRCTINFVQRRSGRPCSDY